MRLPTVHAVVLAGLSTTLVIAVMCLSRPLFLAAADYHVYDALVRSMTTRPPDPRVVIVDIDERSLSAIGQWPWRRTVVGQLITRLRDLGASTIALDMVFAEPDRYAGSGVTTDAALAETLRGGRAVLGYAMTFDRNAKRANTCVQHPLGLAIFRQGDETADAPFFRATGAICTLPMLTQAAGASGFLNAAPDPDGLLRRVPLLLEFDGRVYPALALAAVAAATGPRDVVLRVVNMDASTLQLDGLRVPLDGKSNLLVRYRGPKRTFPYVSAADVLDGNLRTGAFLNKVVFVGTTALGTREVVSTPLDTLFAGVEVQATVADNLLQQDFIGQSEHAVAFETAAVLLLGLTAVAVAYRFGLVWSALTIGTGLLAAWIAAGSLIATTGTFVSPLFPTLGLAAELAAMALTQFAIEHRRADRAVAERTTSQRLMIQSLLSLTEVRDAETGRHSRRTQRYTRVLAQELATHPQFCDYLTPPRIDLLASLAPLHDIGKVGVPDRLLNKPGALTADELAEIRRHPALGRDVILNAERDVGTRDDVILAMAKDIVYTHHEKWDGTGYPQGLRGMAIPIPGRVMALVDVYDAVLARRVYKAPMSHEQAVELIVAGKGTHFDPAVVDAFVKVSHVLRDLRSGGEAD